MRNVFPVLITTLLLATALVVSAANDEDCSTTPNNCHKNIVNEKNNNTPSSTTSKSTPRTNLGQELIEWLQSKERGYFSEKIALDVNPQSNTANGVFALQKIAKNEVLIVIPQHCLLRPSPDMAQDPMDMCETAKTLAREYLLGDDSYFAPYVKYTLGYLDSEKDNDRYKLPGAWSQEGKELLMTIVGAELVEPQGIDQSVDFLSSCGQSYVADFLADDIVKAKFDNKGNFATYSQAVKILQEAWRQVIPRSWNEVMIPVFDMVNHRNGKWHNTDQLTSAHDPRGGDVTIVAIRDIEAGEQLYISYNECHDSDCDGIAHTYVCPQILKDYGFVEQYPRRWRFDFAEEDEDVEEKVEENAIIFEIDQEEEEKENNNEPKLKLTWLSSYVPTLEQIHILRGILNRQYGLKKIVTERLQQISSKSEKEVILNYYQALTSALEMVLQDIDINPRFYNARDPYSNRKGELAYDDLEERKRGSGTIPEDEDEEDGYSICASGSAYMGDAPYEDIDNTKSQYQGIRFEHNSEINDTCLYLSEWLQTCTSWRPHYHETVVHYPLRFVDEVKRVIFLGGGDNMLLHEILKYPSLELVMGLELDHQVVRSSFKNMGTQPHFDNDKVQWWFGDATKTLSMLLEQGDKFYHTFDLVVVDLQTNVAETLMVTKDMSIMDVAVELLQPNGIIARNEDFYPRRSVGFVKYEVDLEVLDIPMLCQQSITIGSKNVDFLIKTPKNHQIDTVYLDKSDVDDGSNKYARWLNYRHNPDPSCNMTKSSFKLDQDAVEDMADGFGVHMILEVEEATVVKESTENISKRIRNAMNQAGLTELSVTSAPSDDLLSVYLYTEGYVVAQVYKEHHYIAFDIKLWSDYAKLETARNNLVAAVGSKSENSASAFRIVTGGMFGTAKKASCTIPLDALGTCEKQEHMDSAQVEPIKEKQSMTILREAIKSLANEEPVVAVVCPNDQSPCLALEAVSNDKDSIAKSVIPLRACPGLANAEEMLSCEKAFLASLTKNSAMIDAIVIDVQTPKEMGQILHKVLSDKPRRVQLLRKEYVIFTMSHDAVSSSWKRALVERFQTEFDPYSPAQRLLVSFDGNTRFFELGVFSAGDYSFFSHLEDFIRNTERATGLLGKVRKVEDGRINYIPGFHPSVIGSGEHYENGDALEQWLNQAHMGQQTIFQFEIEPSLAQIEAGERVLVNGDQDVWKGQWFAGQVIEVMENGEYAVIVDDAEGEVQVKRDAIRIFETGSPLEVREPVLIKRDGYWSQGAVIGMNPEEGTFTVRTYDSNGDIMTVRREDLVRRQESVASNELPTLSCTKISAAFTDALEDISEYIEMMDKEDKPVQVSRGFADGCIMIALWPEGTAVASWDGRAHLDVSLFLTDEEKELRDQFADSFLEELSFLKLAARDDFPRGFGRVVNFKSEVNDPPHWTDLMEDES